MGIAYVHPELVSDAGKCKKKTFEKAMQDVKDFEAKKWSGAPRPATPKSPGAKGCLLPADEVAIDQHDFVLSVRESQGHREGEAFQCTK
jgi:hypothetical protein